MTYPCGTTIVIPHRARQLLPAPEEVCVHIFILSVPKTDTVFDVSLAYIVPFAVADIFDGDPALAAFLRTFIENVCPEGIAVGGLLNSDALKYRFFRVHGNIGISAIVSVGVAVLPISQ